MINKWGELGIHVWDLLPELQDQGWAGFHEQKEALFACLPAM
jgi:hypothetical protein